MPDKSDHHPPERPDSTVETLRCLWQEGLASGPLEPLDMAAIRAEARRRLRLTRLPQRPA